MKVFCLNQSAQIPKLNEVSKFFELKSNFYSKEQKVTIINPLNKETYTTVRNNYNKLNIQVYPQQRVIIPTGLKFEIPKNHVLKIIPFSHLAIKKGLTLINGIEYFFSDYDNEVFITLNNISDAVSWIDDNETIAYAVLEKSPSYNLEDGSTESVKT